jgi:hypothetical protein
MNLLDAAVAENAQWCTLICRLHGIESRVEDDVWRAVESPPPFYPASITLRRGISASTILPAGPNLGIKDSYADLRLSEHGCTELFEGSWIAAPAQDEQPDDDPRRWASITNAQELERWRAAHSSAGALKEALLAERAVSVIYMEEGGRITSGAVLHRAPKVIAISNVFGDPMWRGLAAAAVARFGDSPVVGYESGTELAAARADGWSELGPMRVWLSPPTA